MGARKKGDPLARYVETGTGCWEWIGAVTQPAGYGVVWTGERQVYAHRYFYELLVGPIPDGLQIDHLCRNRKCVNPAHLEPVTQAENVARSPLNPAHRTHCPKGHGYTPENTWRERGRNGRTSRRCRTCLRERLARTYARRRAGITVDA